MESRLERIERLARDRRLAGMERQLGAARTLTLQAGRQLHTVLDRMRAVDAMQQALGVVLGRLTTLNNRLNALDARVTALEESESP
jgi:hypothetical protein